MTVSIDDLYVASQWLDVYEGAEDREACQRVARMLEKMISEREQRAVIEKGVKELQARFPHVSEAEIRRRVKQHLKESK